ncbi:MAG: patatin-like protein [Dehalococcoidales bacterium]|nr:patatin-like protein [Dehalococcoidales bacterium]
MTQAINKPKNEVRVGLVLYGGVSLAIYIYGVVLEFLRAMRAADGEADNPYRDLLEKTESKMVVDIISGTSAGGINGILLAKALANGLNSESFGLLRNIWLEAADLSTLLKPGRPEMAALLDENFFEERLAQGLKQIDDKAEPDKPAVKALDLYVSSTDLYGRIASESELGKTFFNTPIESKEYRRMFHFRFRTKGYNNYDTELGQNISDFTGEMNETLVKASRATSAFPFALRPVTLHSSNESDKRLMEPDEDTVYLTDGGVLNNKPFSDAIAAIFKRHALNKVDRVLYFVEPDPETFVKDSSKKNEPGFWEVLAKAVVGIRSYESITNDMKTIKSRNKRIEEFKAILDATENVIQEGQQDLLGKKGKQYRTYLENQSLYKGYEKLKLARLNTRLQDLFIEHSVNLPGLKDSTVTLIQEAFEKAFEELAEKPGQMVELLECFDSQYRIRRLYRLVEITELLYKTPELTGDNLEKIDEYLERISALLENIHHTEWRTWSSTIEPHGWFVSPIEKMREYISALQKDINKKELKKRIRDLLETMLSYSNTDFKGLKIIYKELSDNGLALVKEIDSFVETLNIDNTHPLAGFPPMEKIYTQFEYRDMFIHPVEVIADLGERDLIEVMRISPKDAKFITSDLKKKVAGDTFFHFGGFLKKEWRDNDIMWGRLDAAEIIVRTLCSKSENKIDEDAMLDPIIRNILAGDNEKSRKAVAPEVDYKRYMVEDYDIGAESLKDIPRDKRARMILNAVLSLRDMFKYDMETAGKKNKVFGFLDKWIGRILNYVSIPLTLLIRSLFDKDSLVRTIFSVAILGIGIWGTITLVLYILGLVFSLDWLDMDMALVWIAAGTIVVATILGFLSIKYRVKKPKTQQSKTEEKNTDL